MMHPARLTTIACLALLTAACVKEERIAGNIFNEKTVEQLKTGESTRADVERVMGSPSSKSDFGDETWLYINSTLENHAFLPTKTASRNVVAVAFDDTGTVNDIRRYTEQDGKVIEISSDKTPTEGRKLNAIQQLLGNVGKFNQRAADAGGE